MPCKTISLEAVATIGIDIGKNTFHLIGLDKMGASFCARSCRATRSQLVGFKAASHREAAIAA